MSRRPLPAVLLAALATALCFASPSAGSQRGAATAAAAGPKLFVNGDSLAVGTGVYLPGALPGWRIRSSTSISRHAYEGPPILRAQGRRLPKRLLISLGTNDDPSHVSGFEQAVRDTMKIAGPRRCVVWFNIVRPPYAGVSYAGYNRVLKREAAARPNLRVVNWVRMVRRNRRWLRSDGVHVSATGYRARARAAARVVRACR